MVLQLIPYSRDAVVAEPAFSCLLEEDVMPHLRLLNLSSAHASPYAVGFSQRQAADDVDDLHDRPSCLVPCRDLPQPWIPHGHG